MTDPPIYYPWQTELFAALAAERAEKGRDYFKARPFSEMDKPKSRMSDLVRFARLARNQPEIWDRVTSLAARISAGGPYPEEEQSNLGTFCGQFADWFRMKNNIDDIYIPFALTTPLLLKWASGELDQNDEEATRSHYRGPFTVDDLEAVAERQEGLPQ